MIEKLQEAIENETWDIKGMDNIKINVEVETEICGTELYIDIMRNIHAGEIMKYLAEKYNVNVRSESICGDTYLVLY